MLLNRLFRVEAGEWPKLLQFGLLGLLLQTGMGVGFAAGDAAFLSHVGPDKLPIIFLLTPGVMLVYTAVFSVLMVRLSLDRVVDVALALLVAGGALLWALIEFAPPGWGGAPYYGLKLYLAMWYIGLYTLFWTFTDAYFDIQDAKRLFPLFAAFCALGAALGALVVGLLADYMPTQAFLLVWAGLALAAAPLVRRIRIRWRRIADSDADLDAADENIGQQLRKVVRTFRTSPYGAALALTLFVTLLLTNLAEFQYSTVLQEGRSEAELAGLFGRLYGAANLFNLVVCLFVFNRLVTRIGVRNVALVLPATYFAVFAVFFIAGGAPAALAAFFAYHGVLTSIEYNNQNLLFNATPAEVKRPFRTVVEGLAEPLASLLAGGFLLWAAKTADMRELSGLGVILGAILIAVVLTLRRLYPLAMEANMRRGWLNFADQLGAAPVLEPAAIDRLRLVANESDPGAAAVAHALLQPPAPALPPRAVPARAAVAVEEFAARLTDPSATTRKAAVLALRNLVGPEDIGLVAPLLEALPDLDREGRSAALELLGFIGDVETIPQLLSAAARLSPRELRATEGILIGMGEAAVPRLIQVLGAAQAPHRARAAAARALCVLSQAQFASQLQRLVDEELDETARTLALAEGFEAEPEPSPALALLASAHRERVGQSVDLVLELLALGGRLPDFDLLVVSLHSANPKVRGNAIEAIASGVGQATWARLGPLVTRRTRTEGAEGAGDLVPRLEAAATSGRGFEALCAAQALRDRVGPATLPQRLRRAMTATTPAAIRKGFAILLGLGAEEPTLVDLVDAIRRHPDFALASMDAHVALAEKAAPTKPGHAAVAIALPGACYWLSHSDIDETATRYPDLALAMLKARDERSYAA